MIDAYAQILQEEQDNDSKDPKYANLRMVQMENMLIEEQEKVLELLGTSYIFTSVYLVGKQLFAYYCNT